MSGPTATVCIVSHDSGDEIAGCLAAVERLEGAPVEAVVVDCASTDGSATTARALSLRIPVEVVELAENVGFAGGMNEAIARSSAPFILSLNPDARPAPDFLARLLARLDGASSLEVGAVTGRLIRPVEEGHRILDAAGMRLTRSWRHLDRGSNEIDHGQYRRPERVFGATGAATLFVRRALDDTAVDGEYFLAEFHSFREDAELCFRLRERGWEVLYEPQAQCIHRRLNLPERRREMPAAVNYHSLKNRYLLRLYHQTASNLWRTALPTLARDLAIAPYVVLRERTSLAAYRWLAVNRRRILARRRAIQGRRLVPARDIDRWFSTEGEPL